MDKGSGAVRRVPFWRSLQTKFALTYIVIVAAVLILLNTYPLVVSEKLAYQSKQASMLNQAFAFFVLAMLPILVLYLCLQKYIVSGITAGAVKG